MDGEQQAPRILGAVHADEAEIPLDSAAVRAAVEKARLGHELTDEERERIRAAMQSLVPIFEQMRAAFVRAAEAMAPILAQLGEGMRKVGQATQQDYALAPARPGARRRGPGRRGREAQRSPYGPHGRR